MYQIKAIDFNAFYILYVMHRLSVQWEMFKTSDKIQFKFHIKQDLYWTNINQN
jgi:hypothetical protein